MSIIYGGIMINHNATNIQQILDLKIKMMEDLLESGDCSEETQKLLELKLAGYRARLANLLLLETLA